MTLVEHTQGYTVFATGGVKRNITGILKIIDSKGNIVEEYKDEGEQIFDERSTYMVNWILCDLGNFGDQPFSKQYYTFNGKRNLCGKTGTTTGPRDLVAIQYHKNLVVSIWAGNNNNRETPGAWSTTVPLPIASIVMHRLADRYPPEMYTMPEGIASTTVCDNTGARPAADSDCKKVKTIYAVEHPPRKVVSK
jgi:penicillin-binding protein 1A